MGGLPQSNALLKLVSLHLYRHARAKLGKLFNSFFLCYDDCFLGLWSMVQGVCIPGDCIPCIQFGRAAVDKRNGQDVVEWDSDVDDQRGFFLPHVSGCHNLKIPRHFWVRIWNNQQSERWWCPQEVQARSHGICRCLPYVCAPYHTFSTQPILFSQIDGADDSKRWAIGPRSYGSTIDPFGFYKLG